MKTQKKVLLVFSLLLLQSSFAQEKIQIMVLGTSHQNEASDSLSIKKVIEKLKAFKPDMVFGEFVRPEDYLTLDPESYDRKNTDPIFAFINQLNPETKSTEKQIKKKLQALAQSENFHKIRIDLAVDYLKKYDLANGKYQIFILNKYKASHFGKEEATYFQQHLGNRDSLQSHKLYRETSEYAAIIYPLMYDLGLPKIYSMDCQAYDVKWSNSWRLVAYIMHYIGKIAKLDPNSEEAKIVQKRDQVMADIETEIQKSKLEGYALFNSDLNAKQANSVNFYGGEAMFGFSKQYPEKFVKDMIKYWTLRNEGMAKNAITQIREKGAKKVIIATGNAHQKWIEDILAKEKDVEIIRYN